MKLSHRIINAVLWQFRTVGKEDPRAAVERRLDYYRRKRAWMLQNVHRFHPREAAEIIYNTRRAAARVGNYIYYDED